MSDSQSRKNGQTKSADHAGSRRFRVDVERAKGLAIFLVVFGHVIARTPPEDGGYGVVDTYMVLKRAIYLFHMPFFMYLSGYVSFLSGAARMPLAALPGLVRKRFVRLLLPFFAMGLLVLVAKLLAAHVVVVDNVPDGFWGGLRDLFWTTARSPALFIWYLAVLFLINVLTPPALWLLRGHTVLLAGVTLLLFFLPLPERLFLDRLAMFWVFFMLGGLAAEAGDAWPRMLDRYAALALASLVLAAGICIWVDAPPRLAMLLCGVLSIPALHGLVRMPLVAALPALAALGASSFAIYLFNVPSIGVAKALLLRVMDWGGLQFIVVAPLLLGAGLLLPVLLRYGWTQLQCLRRSQTVK